MKLKKIRQATINKRQNLAQFTREERERGVLMKKFAILLPLALLVAFVSAANSQSLADIAKKEKERRNEVKNAKVITSEEAAKYQSQAPADAAAPEAAAAGSEKKEGEAGAKPEAGKADSNESADFQGRTESYWRKTMGDARQKVKDLANESNVLVLKIADLQKEFNYAADNFRREALQRDIQKAYYEQDQNKEKLEKAKAELQGLETEAYKSGALPGWIAEKE
jgi:hypothetical protein